jgi:hypothetical protein
VGLVAGAHLSADTDTDPESDPALESDPDCIDPAQSRMDTGIARHRLLLARVRVGSQSQARPAAHHSPRKVPPGPTSEPSQPAVFTPVTSLAYTQAYNRRTVNSGMVAPSRIALRVAPEVKERWQAEALAQGLSLTAFIVSKVEGQSLPPELETEIRQRIDDVLREQVSIAVAQELQSVLEEKLAPAQDAWPIPADLESLAVALEPKDFDPSCIDADLHHLGTTCASCGGNGLREPRVL